MESAQYEYYSVGTYSPTQIHIGYFKRGEPLGIVLLTERTGNTYVKKNFPSENVFETFQSETALEGYENVPYDHQLGFIHIPKTSGLDITNKFIPLAAYEHNFIIKTPDLHETTADMYTIPSFAILREPISRFISGFKFMNSYARHMMHTDINEFLDNTSDEVLLDNMYKPQYTWLTGNSDNIFIVKYDETNIYNNILPMLKNEFNVDISYDFSDYEKSNVGNSSTLSCTLTAENIERLNQIYSQDIIYYNRLVATGLPYCKFSQLQTTNE
jgi:hypothetical protein